MLLINSVLGKFCRRVHFVSRDLIRIHITIVLVLHRCQQQQTRCKNTTWKPGRFICVRFMNIIFTPRIAPNLIDEHQVYASVRELSAYSFILLRFVSRQSHSVSSVSPINDYDEFINNEISRDILNSTDGCMRELCRCAIQKKFELIFLWPKTVRFRLAVFFSTSSSSFFDLMLDIICTQNSHLSAHVNIV